MKKICKKNLNVPIIAAIIISVIFGIFCFPVLAYADVYVDSYIYDCPDCESGTYTDVTTTNCYVGSCVGGLIYSDATITCTTCGGDTIVTTTTTSNCSTCGADGLVSCSTCYGKGYTTTTGYDKNDDNDKEYWCILYPCTSCGGWGEYTSSGEGYSSAASALSAAQSTMTYSISFGKSAYGSGTATCSTCSGTGTKTTVTNSTCTVCTDGTINTTVSADCSVCVDGVIITETILPCPSCDYYGFVVDDCVHAFDCPDCTDGTYTTETTTDCPSCTDGTKITTTTTTCTSCTDGYDYSSFCLNCGGYGYYVEPIYYKNTTLVGYLLYGCTTCGGSGSSSAVAYADLDFSRITYGCGKGDCSLCVGGLIYTYTTSNCTTCGGEAVLYGDTTYECPTCFGVSCVFKGIDVLTVLPDVAMLDDSSLTVTFDTYEINDVGTVEYIWVINNSIYSSSSSPVLELSSIPIGTYKAYCIVLSQYGFTAETNEFTIYCIDINDYGSLDSSDSSDDFSFTDLFSSVLGNGFSNVILMAVCAVVLVLFLCVIFLYIKRG